MKKFFLTPLLLLAIFTGTSQTSDRVAVNRDLRVTKTQLQIAGSLSDLINGYPADYYDRILNYHEVAITATCEGQKVSISSNGGTLSSIHRKILGSADLGTDIFIKITFTYKDPANNDLGGYDKLKHMEYAVMVTQTVPKDDALYPGGVSEMREYVAKNFFQKLPKSGPTVERLRVKINFTVDEEGRVGEIRILNSSGDPEVDQLALSVFSKMPKWDPARDNEGKKVKQDFTYVVPFPGC